MRKINKAVGKIDIAAIAALKFYKRFISPCLPHACRFEPTCSVYMREAIEQKGFVIGISLGLRRLLKCHPFHKGGFDPVV
ncbi:MAG: membrane protein insertion efficiency factor YidD [Acidobacteriota bacterium]|jgi:putative membrane protein insertion efficiency factor|nr:membrane protein insertion efficiency factor YidD [Acidobacteriota bacterium]